MATNYTINAGDISSNLGIGNNPGDGVYGIASNLAVQTLGLGASSPEILSISYNRMQPSGSLTVTVVSTDETLGGVAKTEYSLNNSVDWIEFPSEQGQNNHYTGYFELEEFALPLGFYIRVTDVDGNQTVSDNQVISGLTVSASAYYWTASDVTISVVGASSIEQMKYSLDDGSSWTELPLSPAAGGNKTGIFLLTENADIIFRVTDSEGNVFTHNPYPYIWIDKDAPVVSTSGSETWTNGVATITVDVTDYSGVNKAYYTFNGAAWTEIPMSSVPGAYTGSFTLDAFGPFAVKVVDNAGNTTITPTRNVRIDKVDPIIDSLTGWETWTNTSQTISVASSDPSIYVGDDPEKPAPGSGIAKIEYTFNGSPWQEITDYTDETAAGNFILDDFGPFAVRVTDKAGNSVVESHNARIDKIAPVVESVTWDKSWTNGPVTVSATFSDVLSGVGKTYWTANGSPWNEFTGSFTLEHNGSFQVKVVDNAGNETLSSNYNILCIDTLAPMIDSISWDLEWTNVPVEVSVAASDDFSGVALVEYSLDEGSSWTVYEEPFEVTANGPIQVRVTDNAGNVTIGEDEVGNIDTLAPTIDSMAWDTDWTKDPVSVTVMASDDLSGVALTEYTLDDGETWTAFEESFEMAENGAFKVRATDNAGNVSLEKDGEVTNIDVTAPAIADPVYDTAWTNSPIMVSVTADDFGQSGVVEMWYTFKGQEWTQFADSETGSFMVSGNGPLSIKAIDAVGNETTSQNYNIQNYDSLAPTIDSIDWDQEWTNGNVTVNVSASDDYSGVAKTYYTFNGTPWTEFEDSFELTANGPFMVKVVDNAGNETISDADPEKEKAQPYNIKTIDRLAPVIDSVIWNQDWTNADSITVSVTAHDEADAANKASGVAAMYYTYNGTPWTEFAFETDEKGNVIGSFTPLDKETQMTENGPFMVKVVDNAGNETISDADPDKEKPQPYNIKTIDRLAPTVDSVTWDKEWTNQPIEVTVAVSDLADALNKASGIAKTEYTFASSKWIEFTDSFEVDHNGSLQIRVTDNAGNVTLSGNYNIRNYDSIAPSIDSIDYSGEWTNGNVTVNVSASDDYSGVAKTYYTFNGTPWTEFEGSFELTANGPFMVKVVDNAGNETISDADPEKEKAQPYNIKTIDRLAPVIDTIDYSNEWTTGNVTVSVTAHDAPEDAANKSSGVAAMYYTFNGNWWAPFEGSFELDANGPFMVKVVDGAGNETTSQHYNIKSIDKLAPVVDSVTWNKDWTNSSITVTVAVSDLADAANKASGIAKTEYTFAGSLWAEFTDSFVVEHNGSLQIRVTDNAGNVKLSSNYNIWNYDSLAPKIDSISWDHKWTNVPVEVSVSASDDHSGVALVEYTLDGGSSWTVYEEPFEVAANGPIQVRVTDNAGNVTVEEREVTNIDTSLPEISIALQPSDWTVGNVTVYVTASSALSGIAKTEYTLNGGLSWTEFTNFFMMTKNGTVQVRATDNAGNMSIEETVVSNIDRIAPAIADPVFNTDWTNSPITVSVTADDFGQSGVAEMWYTFKGQPWKKFADSETGTFDVAGNGPFAVKAIDAVGHETTSKNYNIRNYDNIVPTINTIDWNHEWTKNPVNVSVTASDDYSGVALFEYTLDGGMTWTEFTDTFTVSKNGTFQVRVTDKAGNVKIEEREVTNIDPDMPVITISFNPSDWTNGAVTVYVTVDACASGIAKTDYSLDGGYSWTVFTDTFQVDSDGPLQVRATDNVGNVSIEESEVTNIDVTAPAIADPVFDTNWTNTPISVSVTADDFGQSGVVEMWYTFKGQPWKQFADSATGTFEAAGNGPFAIKAIDAVGNETTSKNYNISKYDIIAPTIDSIDWNHEWTNKSVTVSVSASDDYSGVALVEYTLDGGSSWTVYEEPFEVDANGPIQVRVTDNAGNVTIGEDEVGNIDKIQPTINSPSWNHEWTKDPVTVNVNATDNLSGIASTEYSFNGGEWTVFTNNAFTVTENGTFRVRATDNAGNQTVSDAYSVTNIDPDGPTISVTLNPTKWTKDQVTVTVTASAASGVKSMEYSLNGGGWTVFTNSFTLTENGTFTIRVKDNAGGETSNAYEVTNIDKVKPVINEVNWNTAWTKNPVAVSVSASDNLSGVAKMEYSFKGGQWTAFTNSFTVTENGTFNVRVTDNAGNETVSAAYSVTTIDKVAPTIESVSWDTAWTKNPVTVNVNATDNLSGIALTEYSFKGGQWTAFTNSFTVTENGTFTVRVTDNAGNVMVSDAYDVTNIDKVQPVINSVNWDTAWTKNPVTVNVNATDNLSGIASTEYSFKGGQWTVFTNSFAVTDNGTFQVRATDNAGNVKVSGTYEVTNIDKVAPSIDSVSWNTDWTNASVTVSVSASDALSGVKTTEYSLNGGGWIGFTNSFAVTENGTFNVRVTDNVGNETISSAYNVTNIDKVAPVINSIDWDKTSSIKTSVTVTVTATDELSGVAKMEYLFNGSGWTEFTDSFVVDKNGEFQVRVTDNAGNVTMGSGDVESITSYTVKRNPDDGKYGYYIIDVDFDGTYQITGDFGNVSGTITITNNDVSVSGTITQGVLKIGTNNKISLAAGETIIEVEVKNGSLYLYEIDVNRLAPVSATSSLQLFGEELEDAAGLLQMGAASASFVQLDEGSAESDFAAGFDDVLKSAAVESALTALNGSEVYSGVDTDLDQFSKLNTFSVGLLAG